MTGLGVTGPRPPEPDGNDDPDLAYVFDPLLVSDRGAIPLRPGKPNRGGEPAVRRGVDARRRGSRRPAGSRRRARSRAATRSGCGRTCCASGGRSGRTTPGPASSPRSSAATSGSSTSRTGAARPSSIHLLSVVSPVADDVAVVYLPLLPVGLWELMRDLGIRLVAGSGRGVPDARAATCWPSGRAS